MRSIIRVAVAETDTSLDRMVLNQRRRVSGGLVVVWGRMHRIGSERWLEGQRDRLLEGGSTTMLKIAQRAGGMGWTHDNNKQAKTEVDDGSRDRVDLREDGESGCGGPRHANYISPWPPRAFITQPQSQNKVGVGTKTLN